MRRLAGIVAAAAVTALGLGLGGGAAASGPAGSSPSSLPRCATSALRAVSLGGQGAAGTQFALLRLELRRPGRCTLGGYPGVTLLDGRHRLGIHVTRRPNGTPRTFTLDADHDAYFDFAYASFGVPDAQPCKVRVSGLRIIPPNERHSLAVRFARALKVCRTGQHAVTPVRPTSGT